MSSAALLFYVSIFISCLLSNSHLFQLKNMDFNRGRVGDRWSSRLLWLVAIGSAVGFYMVAVERQTQNRAKMMAEAAAAGDFDD